MLSHHDESLFHQAPLTFAETVTSDHRFYDRVFFMAFDPAGGASVMLGMGIYKNMNVIDGFACAMRNGRQYNLRASRPLRPPLETEVGPIRYEILEPLRRLRFAVAPNDSGVALDLAWTAAVDPYLEGRWGGNRRSVNGRTAIDTQRFDGIGRWNGWIEVDGERLAVHDWCGARDHSWGVRGGVGGYEPVNGPNPMLDGKGFFLGVFHFGDDREYSAHALWTEDGTGRYESLEGGVRWRADLGRPDLELIGLKKNIDFPPDRRQYHAAQLEMTMSDGSVWRAQARQAMPGTILKGYGGHGEGFADKRGFGVHRGELVEHDIYDPEAPDMKQLPVETPIRVHVEGRGEAFGFGTVLATGAIPQYGLRAQSETELRRYSIMIDNLRTEPDAAG
ncbi:MAG: hypothetical protein AB7Q97_14635 [Gammaproteobacteria bacterium]